MLEKLHDKFEDERTDLEKEESNARHASQRKLRKVRWEGDFMASRQQRRGEL